MKSNTEIQLEKEREEYIKKSYAYKIKQELLRKYKEGTKFNAFITINPNQPYRYLSDFQRHIDYFYSNICCRIFNRYKYIKEDSNSNYIDYIKYFNYYGFLEYTQTDSPHYHFVAYLDPRAHAYFKNISEHLLHKTIESATIDVQYFESVDLERIISYCLKKPEQYLFSTKKANKQNEIIFPRKYIKKS